MKAKTDFGLLIKQFEHQFDLRTVFGDFLTMSLCSVTQNPVTKMSHYEDEYLQTIEKYKASPLRHEFPKLFAQLVIEMEERHSSSNGNDVLGEFYEQHLYRKGASQYFTPQPVCEFMAQIAGEKNQSEEPLNILDPACGSGRMLLSASRSMGKNNHFFGIDIDQQCAQMTALNLFLNGLFHSEVMWGDALNPNDFRMSYRISLLPFGVFRTYEKEKSLLWRMLQNNPVKEQEVKTVVGFNRDLDNLFGNNNSQLVLF